MPHFGKKVRFLPDVRWCEFDLIEDLIADLIEDLIEDLTEDLTD